MGILQNRFGFWQSPLATAFGCSKLWLYPLPDVEIAGNRRTRRIAHSQLRYFYQTRLDRIYQPEIADDPWEGTVGIRPHTSQIIRRCGKIDAEIDATMFVHLVETVDPYRRLTVKIVKIIILVLIFIRLIAADTVGVMGFVIQNEDVALAANLAPPAILNLKPVIVV